MYVRLTRAQQTLHLSYSSAHRRAGENLQCVLAQEDLRYAERTLSEDEATEAKQRRNTPRAALKAMVMRS